VTQAGVLCMGEELTIEKREKEKEKEGFME
jgi:hypothetical protein